MLDARTAELFNIKYPIIGGAMHNISKAELVAAISNSPPTLSMPRSTAQRDSEN